eukprot:403331332
MLSKLSLTLKQKFSKQSLVSASFRSYGGPVMASTEGFIDLRSDTVTRPTKKMREAMKSCKVGDDVYSDDPSVNKLQEEIAKLFGKEAALFVPTGTMSNLIGMMLNVRMKGEGAILGSLSHIYNIERGGISALGGIHPIIVPNEIDGTMNLQTLERSIPPVSIHLSQPRVIALENSHNLCNGSVLKPEYVKDVRQIANRHKLRMHLDGARSLNAAVYLNMDPAKMVEDFDTVNFCLSKGMSCPVGSLIIGRKEDINHAMALRKMLGGAMRQVGVLASCGLVALEDWKEKLSEDHENARALAQGLSKIPWIDVDPSIVQTNIFRFSIKGKALEKFDHAGFCGNLRENHNILINPSFQNDAIRVVTHREFTKKNVAEVIKAFQKSI